MAKFNASTQKLHIVESSVAKLVAHLTNLSLSFSGETIDLTSKDNNGFKDFIMGLKSFSLSVEGFVDFQTSTDQRNFDDFMTAARAGTPLTVLVKNSTVGDTTIQGTAYVTGLDLTSGTEEGATFTANLEFSGDVTIGAVAS
jgi:predicted secreted protein